MVDVFKSKHERDILLGRCRALEAESYKVSDGRESDRLFDASLAIKAEYLKRLPIWTLSVCPICGAPYQHRLDPFSLMVHGGGITTPM